MAETAVITKPSISATMSPALILKLAVNGGGGGGVTTLREFFLGAVVVPGFLLGLTVASASSGFLLTRVRRIGAGLFINGALRDYCHGKSS